MTPFPATTRHAFNGLALVIVRGRREVGTLTVIARSDGLQEARLVIRAL